MKRAIGLSFAQGQLMLWILIGSLLAVVSMLVFFRVTGVRRVSVTRETTHIEWMPAASASQLHTNDERYIIADLNDPSLMSLPSAHGFSRAVWRRKIEAAQRSLGWNEQPSYLDVTFPGTPASLLEPVPLDAAVLSAAEKNPAQSEESDEQAPEAPVMVNVSVFRVLGPIEDRGVMHAPELPVLSSSVPVRPTQVRVGVDPDGLVRYALIDRSYGNEIVDAQSVLLARQFRFEATQSSDPILTWGIVRFLWAAQGTTPTNLASAATQP
jgi:hypothetical protein